MKMKTLTLNGTTYQVCDPMAVSVEAQELTEEQKLQARQNLGLEKTYELIEDITLDADTAQFVRTEDPNGVAYDFSAIKVHVRTPACASLTTTKTALIHVRPNSSGTLAVEWAELVGNTVRNTIFKAYNDCGMVEAYTACANASGLASYNRRPVIAIQYVNWANVKELSISMFNSDVVIPAGTQIKIYAIRG